MDTTYIINISENEKSGIIFVVKNGSISEAYTLKDNYIQAIKDIVEITKGEDNE